MGGHRGEPTRPGRLASFAADRTRRTASADRWLASLLGAEPGVALADADALLRHLAGAGRTVAHALDQSLAG